MKERKIITTKQTMDILLDQLLLRHITRGSFLNSVETTYEEYWKGVYDGGYTYKKITQ